MFWQIWAKTRTDGLSWKDWASNAVCKVSTGVLPFAPLSHESKWPMPSHPESLKLIYITRQFSDNKKLSQLSPASPEAFHPMPSNTVFNSVSSEDGWERKAMAGLPHSTVVQKASEFYYLVTVDKKLWILGACAPLSLRCVRQFSAEQGPRGLLKYWKLSLYHGYHWDFMVLQNCAGSKRAAARYQRGERVPERFGSANKSQVLSEKFYCLGQKS